MAGPTTAFAQSTWSLPPGQQEGQGAPRPQGPVDPQNPTVTPRDTAPDVPAAAPAAAPTSRPTPVPTIAAPPPPAAREHGRNAGWRHLNNADVLSMPDTWEYPW
ncbi:MAG: hypothetical protein ACRECB_15860, partial [Novosphingobium sp.]